jgi:uncharacterized protein (DUF488 family)
MLTVVIKMVDTVYSIGYSGFSMSDFINTLQSNKISLVVDVRSHPYSQYFSDYNKESLEQTLKYIRNILSQLRERVWGKAG